MEDLIRFIKNNPQKSLLEISRMIKNVYIDLLNVPQEDVAKSFSILTSFIQDSIPSVPLARWNQIKFLLSLIPRFYVPSETMNLAIPVQTDYPPLFSTYFRLHEMIGDIDKYVPEYVKVFSMFSEDLEKTKPRSFYSMISSHFIIDITALIQKYCLESDYTQLFIAFINGINRISPDRLNINDLCFIAPSFINIATYLKKNPSKELFEALSGCYTHLLKLASSAPAVSMVYLFHPWFYFIKQLAENNQIDCGDQIKMVSVYFEQISGFKHHELHTLFQWYLLFYFYSYLKNSEPRARMMIFICQAMKTVENIDKHKQICQTVDKFVDTITKQHQSGDSWPFYYILTNLETRFVKVMYKLNDIYGVHIDIAKSNSKKSIIVVPFRDQCFRSKPIDLTDDVLTTDIQVIQKDCFDEGLIEYEKQVTKIDRIVLDLRSIIKFQEAFIRVLVQDIDKSNMIKSITIEYLFRGVKEWTRFMILASHKIVSLEYFYQRYINTYKLDKSLVTNSIIKPIPDLSSSFDAYIRFILLVPPKYYYVFASVMAQEIYKGIKKGIVTLHFIKSLVPLQNDTIDELKQIPFYSHLLGMVSQKMIESLDMLMSPFRNEAQITLKMITLITRISIPNDEKLVYPYLWDVLKNNQKLLTNWVFNNMKRIPNQDIALWTIAHIAISLNSLFSETNETSEQQKTINRKKSVLFEEITSSMKSSTLEPIFNTIESDFERSPLGQHHDFYLSVFRSNNPHLILKASKLYNLIVSQNGDIDFGQDELFNQWLSHCISYDDKMALNLVNAIYKHPDVFIKDHNYSTIMPNSIPFGNTGVSILSLLEAIENDMKWDKQNVFSLFQLIVLCFSFIEQSYMDYIDSLYSTLSLLISLFCTCYVCKEIRPKIDEFSQHLIIFFGDLFANSISNSFWLALVNSCGISRSVISQFSLKLSDSLLSYVSTKNYMNNYLSQSLDEMFVSFYRKNNFSLVLGLSSFSKVFSEIIQDEHIIKFLYSSEEMHPLEIDIPDIFKEVMNRFSSRLNDTEKVRFVQKLYNVLGTISTGCRQVVLHVISLLNVQISEPNLTEQDLTPDNSIAFQKLSAVLVSKTPFPISDQMPKIITDFISNRNDITHPVEKLSRRMSFCLSILRSPNLFIPKKEQTPNFIATTLNFLCNTLTYRFSSLHRGAQIAFRYIVENYPSDSQFYGSIEEYCKSPDKIFQMFNYQQHDRFSFYRRLTKLVPTKMPSSVISSCFNAFYEYSKYPKSGKYIHSINLYHIVKQLSLKSTLSLEANKAQVKALFNDTSNLEAYIKKVFGLMKSYDLPFRQMIFRYISRFFVLFSDECVSYVFKSDSMVSSHSFSVLTDIIKDDSSNVVLMSFIRCFDNIEDVSLINISAFETLFSLSKFNKYVVTSEFSSLIDSIFLKLIKCFNDKTILRPHAFIELELISKTYLRILRQSLTIPRMISMCNLFNISSFLHTRIYDKFIELSFKHSPAAFVSSIIPQILSSQPQLTTKVLGIIFSHSIKYSNPLNEKTVNDLWEFLTKKLTQTKVHSSILLCALRLFERSIPPNDTIKVILQSLKSLLSSSDTQSLYYSLKFSLIMLKSGYLPHSMYFGIAQQLFSHLKFFDDPFLHMSIDILSFDESIFENSPSDFIETISFFVHEKFTNTRDGLKVIEIFLSLNHLIKLMPFSIITFLSRYINMKLSKGADIGEIDPLVCLGIKLCETSHVCINEMKPFLDTSLRFFAQNINSEKFSESFHSVVFGFLISQKYGFISNELHNQIIQSSFGYGSFCYLSFLCSIESPLLSREESFIDQGLKYFDGNVYKLSYRDFEMFLDYIISHGFIKPKNVESLHSISISMIKSFSSSLCDRVTTISKYFIKSIDIHERYGYLVTFWTCFEDLIKCRDEVISDLGVLFRFLCMCIEDINPEDQTHYIELINEKSRLYEEFGGFYYSIVSLILRSERVICSSKDYLIRQLPSLIKGPMSFIFAPRVSESIIWFGNQIKKDYSVYSIMMFLRISFHSTNSERMTAFKTVLSLLPTDSHISLALMMKRLDFCFWSDTFLPLIVPIYLDSIQTSLLLFSFSPSLKKLSGKIFQIILCKMIDEGFAVLTLTQFIVRLLSSSTNYPFIQVIGSILGAFFEKNIKIDANTAYKAIKISGCSQYIPFFLGNQISSPKHVICTLPSAHYYSQFKNDLSIKSASACALTMLHQYQLADSLFRQSSPESNQFSHVLASLNSLFQSYTFGESISQETMINSSYDSYLILLMNSLENDKTNSSQIIEVVNQIDSKIADSLRSHPNLTLFQKEKIIVLKSISQIFRDKIESTNLYMNTRPLLEVSLCPFLFKSVDGLYGRVNQIEKPERLIIDSSEEPVLFLSPRFSNVVKSISGYSPNGYLATGRTFINHYLQQFVSPISDLTSDSFVLFGSFCLSLFHIQRDNSLVMNSLFAYSHFLGKSINLKSPSYQESVLRIITLIDIIYLNHIHLSTENIDLAKLFSAIDSKVLAPHLFSLIKIINRGYWNDSLSSVFFENPHKSYIYSDFLGNHNMMDLLQSKYQSNRILGYYNSLNGFFDKVLSIDFSEMNHQKELTEMLTLTIDFKQNEASSVSLDEGSHVSNVSKFFSMLNEKEKQNAPTFLDLIEGVKNLSIDTYVKIITNSKLSYIEYQNQILELIKGIEPTIFSISAFCKDDPTLLNQIHSRVFKLSNDMLLINASTPSRAYFPLIVTKSPNLLCREESIIGLQCFDAFKSLLDSVFFSSVKSMSSSLCRAFDVAPHFVLYNTSFNVLSMQNIIETSERKHSKLYQSKSNSLLKEYLVNQVTLNEFIRIRETMLNSYSTYCAFRYVFESGYPHLENIVLSTDNGLFPVYLSSIITKPASELSFRLSPNIIELFGQNSIYEIEYSFASFALSVFHNIDTFDSILEHISNTSETSSFDEIIESRDIIRNRLMDICPPTSPIDNENYAIEWFSKLGSLIEIASSPDSHTEDPYPWF